MQEPFLKQKDEYYIIKSWNDRNKKVIAGFTTKNNGISKSFNGTLNLAFHVQDNQEDVQQNRRHLASEMGFSIEQWVSAEQTHEVNIKKIDERDKSKGALDYGSSIPRTDGFYSDSEDILLTMCYADCVPIFYFSPKAQRIGVVHAGWKGTTDGIAQKMADMWAEEGISKEDILAVIGPSICQKCYIVDEKVIDKVQKWVIDSKEMPYNEISTGQYELNLRKLNQIILENSGIPASNISVTTLCTSCDQEEFFSHRRDKGNTGRMLAFIGMKGELA
jgi:YfiH family protein